MRSAEATPAQPMADQNGWPGTTRAYARTASRRMRRPMTCSTTITGSPTSATASR